MCCSSHVKALAESQLCCCPAVMQASADEYEMQANGVKPWTQEGVAITPWRCLRGCDQDASCMGVSITKLNSSWVCWFVHGGFGLGSTASSIKATPGSINTYYWAWATNSTTPQVSDWRTSHVRVPACMPWLGD